MKKRGKLFLLLAVSLLVLAGWGQKKVELLSDKKLIDLSAAIGNCTLGADDMTQDDGTSTQNPEESDTAEPTAGPSVTPRPTPQPGGSSQPIIVPTAKTIIISIRDEVVIYDLRPVEGIESLKKKITADNADHISFQLVDNYAEAHVFRQVMALLEEMEAELGIRYIRE